MEPNVELRRMWLGGPLRQFAAEKVSNAFIPYGERGSTPTFAGRYACDGCQMPTAGLYPAKTGKGWLCAGCKGRNRTTGAREFPSLAVAPKVDDLVLTPSC